MLHIRNFCILAHIDHGKSTLADRFLEITGTVEKRKMHEQYLDMHPLEQEKGITIKMQPVRMIYHPNGGNQIEDTYILNLIDTPGHVDFTYEVSRALAAVEGAILLVDATQGVQAQTLANLALARKEGLVIIPVINKIDLPSADIIKTEAELKDLFEGETGEILKISAKTGIGVDLLLREIVKKVPQPKASTVESLRALIFDSLYDPYQGIIAHVRVFDGAIRRGRKIFCIASKKEAEVLEVGVFIPGRSLAEELLSGEIGYIATGIKEPSYVRVGDTITNLEFGASNVNIKPLPGYREPEPMVYASVFPENQDDFPTLKDSFEKLKLNDAALSFEIEESSVLGRGFRTGFLGMLHMEIISERLKREYQMKLIFSNPSVAFRIKRREKNSSVVEEETIYSASKMPDSGALAYIEEPWAAVEVIAPPQYFGSITTLIHDRSGTVQDTANLAGERVRVRFEAPLREIIIDFYDVLKSVSQGFASMSYEPASYRRADLVRLDILIAGEKIPSFSEIIPKDRAYSVARIRVERLKELLPRELFEIALQAESDGRIIARETIPALRKDVTGYLYGGDRTRKMKLWKKQQRGKKRLKGTAHVNIPTEVFLQMLKKK